MGVSSGGRGGTILQTASLAGLLTSGWSSHTEYTYTATKHAAVALTRGLGDATCSAWSRDRVRVLAVCPWVVDTRLVRAGVASMSEEERARKQNSWVHRWVAAVMVDTGTLVTVNRFIAPEVVAQAVARLLEAGQPGEVITVGPDNTAYTVPSTGLAVFLACKLAHSLLSALGLVAEGEVVTVRKLAAALLFLLLATFTLLHLALSYLGL